MTFQHQHSAHCESGVVSSLLANAGIELDEPMVFGLSSSLVFAYLPLIKISGMPLIAYRMPPGFILKGIEKRLNISFTSRKFRNEKQAMLALDQQLSKGNVVGLQASVYWLPYFPEDMRFHFNAHNLIVYGKNADEYLISDPVFEEPTVCSADDLQRARFSKGALAAKGSMYYLTQKEGFSDPDSTKLAELINKSIKKNCKIMLAPVPFIGVRGIRYMANKIDKMYQRQQKNNNAKKHKYFRLYLGHIVRMQEEIGTGGAGFRFMYAAFLHQAYLKTNNSLYLSASQEMTACGDLWREFAMQAVRLCKMKNIDKTTSDQCQKVTQLLRDCALKEKQIWLKLRQQLK